MPIILSETISSVLSGRDLTSCTCRQSNTKLVHGFGVIEKCYFNRTPDLFNANFVLKPPKVIESRTFVKKANLE